MKRSASIGMIALLLIGSLHQTARAADAPPVASAATLADLNAKFGAKDGSVKFAAGEGGLTCIDIRSALCSGRVYLQGAHVAAWTPAGQEPVLFMSTKSDFISGKPMRGGVPVVFPWFGSKAGDPAAPGHGFARISDWTVDSIQPGTAGEVVVTLLLRSSEKSKTYFPYDFELRHRITFGKDLLMELEVRNTDKQPIKFAEALHSYFHVGAIGQASVSGLDSADFIDKVDAQKQKKQTGDIAFTGQVDRNYLNTQHALTIIDPSLKRKIQIEKTNSSTTVVWNPGQAKAKTIPDLGENDWPNMLCVETANLAESEISLQPGAIHTMKARISVERLAE